MFNNIIEFFENMSNEKDIDKEDIDNEDVQEIEEVEESQMVR